MHLPCAKTRKMLHPAICSYVTIKTCLKVEKIMHTPAEMCTPGAGCTLNFEHCVICTQKVGRPLSVDV